MKKMLLMLLLCFVVVGVVYSCNRTDTLDGEIVVGLEADYPPFNFLETEKTATNVPLANLEGGYVDGYDVQVAIRIAAALNKRLVVHQIEWDGLIPALLNGQIDLIVAGMSPTDERKLEVNFTNAYYTSTHVAIVSNNSPLKGATTLAAFTGYRGVGQTETIYNNLVNQLALAPYNCVVDPIGMGSVPLIVTAILAGTVDFTIVEKPVALGYIVNNSNLALALDVEISNNLFGVGDEDRDVSVAVRKGEDDLLNRINTYLATLTEAERNQIMDAAINQAN